MTQRLIKALEAHNMDVKVQDQECNQCTTGMVLLINSQKIKS